MANGWLTLNILFQEICNSIKMLRNFLLIGLGGAIGSVLRYTTVLMLGTKSFPAATFFINILGSFLIGIVIAFSLKNESFAINWKPFFATGLCGGFTTFSAFSLENLQLLQEGKYFTCGMYVIASVLMGVVAVWLGYRLITN